MKDRSLLAVLVLMWVATAAALTVSILAYQEARSVRAMFPTEATLPRGASLCASPTCPTTTMPLRLEPAPTVQIAPEAWLPR
jgi:hypothetical protein